MKVSEAAYASVVVIVSACSLGTAFAQAGTGPGVDDQSQQPDAKAPEAAVVQATPDTQSAETPAGSPASAPAEAPPPPPAAAAAEAQPSATASNGIETVVVTARRTKEDSQKVPVAITAFSGKDLQREQINTGQDLSGRVPSLVIGNNSQGRNNETPQIRGQGAVFGGSPGVIIYYGEVPLPSDSFTNNQGGPGKFFDLANLQVLKGSQGTLFGRNTTGGALVLEPHKPDSYLEASGTGEFGSFEDRGAEAIVNLPAVDDQLFLRVAAKYYERAGFSKDYVTGEDYDNKGYRTARMGLLWKPTDRLENYLLGYYTHSADNGTTEILQQINDTAYTYPGSPNTPVKLGCLLMAISGSTYKSCGQEVVAQQQANGVRSMHPSTTPDDILDTQALIDSVSYRLTDELTLRDIVSYSLYKHSYKWDMDGSTLILQELTTPTNANSSNTSTYTEELQLQGNLLDNHLKMTTGLYYENLQPSRNLDGINLGTIGTPKPTGTFGDAQVTYSQNLGVTSTIDAYSTTHRSYGPYAQGTYNLGGLFDVLDGLNLTGGARYTVDDQFGESKIGVYVFNVLGDGGEEKDARVKTESPTYTVSLDYKVPTTLMYAKYSHGYKAGGFGVAAVNPENLTFKPETVTNYEVGHKSDFALAGMPLRIDSALYYSDYINQQKTAANSYVPPGSVIPEFGAATYNAGESTIFGFETDATIIPFRGLTATANYSYSYGKYKKYDLNYFSYFNLPIKDCAGNTMANGDTMHLECLPYTSLPRHQASTTLRYELPVEPSLGKMETSATYSFTDRQYTDLTSLPEDSPGAWLGAYGLLNASFQWTAILGSSLDLQLFGTNLTDRTYRIANSNVWTEFFFQSSIYGEPRMYGLQLSYHWDK